MGRHAARLLSVLARASFWILCFHYFGSTAFLLVAASWMFMMGVRDLTFARIRLTSVDDPERRTGAVLKSIALEGALLLLRVGALFALGFVLRPFNPSVASFVWGLMIVPLFWSHETSRALMRAYRTNGMGLYVAATAGVAGLASILYFAETGRSAVEAAVGALLLREAVVFVGLALSAAAGRLGLRVGGDELGEEGGAQQYSVTGAGGREVRAPWKVLIAENVVWSRWRFVQFVTRFAAGGFLGPVGTIGTRLFFSYRQPGAYVHREERISARNVLLAASAAAVALFAAIAIGQRFGLLEALGITIAAFLFRLAAQASNVLLWRQLTPLVAVGAKIRLPGLRRRSG